MSQNAKDALIKKAISFFNQGQIDKSFKETLRARKKYPDEPFIYNLLGVLLAHKEAYEDSVKNYLKAIKLSPKYFEAYNNIGVVYTSWKKNDKAIEYFDRSIQINPSYVEAYNNKGNALKNKQEYHLAVECYEKSISLNPNYVDAITNMGIVCDIIGDFSKAEMYFKKALLFNPIDTSLLYNLANCYFNSKDFNQAIKVCQKIIKIDDKFHYAYNRLGLCCIQIESEEKAIAFFEKAIQIKPDYAEALTNYGFMLQKLRNYSLATLQFEKALNVDPTSDEALLNLSKSYSDEGRLPKAIEIAKKSLSFKPNNIPMLKNLIASLLLLNRFEEASIACKKILSIDENDADAINLMGTIYEKQGFYEEAKNHFLKALELDKELIQAKINIATIHQLEGHIDKANEIYIDLAKEFPENSEVLYRKSAFSIQMENFEEGWKYYKHRWKVFPMNRVIWPIQKKPIWKGEKGKNIVIWKEQGIGDQILFLSLLPEVQEICGDLSVYVDSRLQALCRRAMPKINFVKDIEELKGIDCDYHLPMGNLPGLIRNDISDFEKTVKGYLKADPQRVEAIREELKLKGKTIIGISWRSLNTLNQEKKSVRLQDMGQIFLGLDVVLVNLQYGDVADEVKEFTEKTGIEVLQCASVDNREDLEGLAALIEACDLVVSTSNVTIHMAGALAKETWVMLPYVRVNFWWLLERMDSLWYPSLTLYRQSSLNNWENVFVSIRKELQNLL